MKKLVVAIIAVVLSLSAFSQYNAGTLKVSLALGNSPYVGLLQAPAQNNPNQTLNVQGARWISGTDNNLVNMVGMELKFFVADELSVKFIGGGQTSTTPGQNDIPGVLDNGPYDPQTELPYFNAVDEQKLSQYLFQLGADKYLVKGNAAIYGGVEAGFRYGANSTKNITENSAGTSISEVYGFHAALNFGAEYGTENGLFAGVEIRPVSFAYTACTIEPVPGASQKGDNSNLGFFVYPMLRFGINF